MSNRSLSSTRVKVSVATVVKNVLDDNQPANSSINYDLDLQLANGVSAGQANRAWMWKAKTLTSGASIVLDLNALATFDIGAGAGKDAVGQTIDPFEEIVAILVRNNNAATAAGMLEVKAHTTNGWNGLGDHTVANGSALRGGGLLLKTQPAEAGLDVTASLLNLKLEASGGDVNYTVILLARHDDDESSSSSSSSSESSSSSSESSSSVSSASSLSSQSSSVSSSSSSST